MLHSNNFTTKKLFTIFILILNFSLIHSDIPVHCYLLDIVGKWEITFEENFFKPNLFDSKTYCHHSIPNKEEKQKIDYSIPKNTTYIIELTVENEIMDSNKNKIGTFTLVYDEGMILNFISPFNKNKNSEAFFHFRYYYDNSKGSFISECHKTHYGWFVNDKLDKSDNWKCILGEKIEETNTNSSSNNSDTTSNYSSFIQMNLKSFSGIRIDLTKNYEENGNVVKHLNEVQDSWEAGIHDEFKGKNIKELKKGLIKNSYSESSEELYYKTSNDKSSKSNKVRNKNKKLNIQKYLTETEEENQSFLSEYINCDPDKKRDSDSKDVTSFEEVSKYINTPIEEIDIQTLPKNWNWKDVGGIDYVGEAEDQKDCGSCYIFASVGALNSRLRIKTNKKDLTKFSITYPLSCNIYTEGCHGGYPILVGKFWNEFGIIPESCMRSYDAQTGTCENICNLQDLKDKYKVNDYGYIGGFYGNTNEVDMMKELRARGPIPGNIKVPPSFMFYKGGIFSNEGSNVDAFDCKWSTNTLYKQKKYKDIIEHSTLIVGYGVDEKTNVKYWILRNSWGRNWGENGFFRVRRGKNDISVESMGDFLNIK